MGGNGSKMRGNLDNSATREFKEVFFISNNIKVVQLKDNKKRVRLPEESNTPNRIYVIFNKDGTLKSIGKYGSDCLKKFEIHFDHKHDGLQPHYHKWIYKGENARGPMTSGNGKHSKTVAHAPTKRMIELIKKIKLYAP